jgi:hypothetical protein
MIEENCEVTRYKINGMKTKQWFGRLGSQYYGDLSDPGIAGVRKGLEARTEEKHVVS